MEILLAIAIMALGAVVLGAALGFASGLGEEVGWPLWTLALAALDRGAHRAARFLLVGAVAEAAARAQGHHVVERPGQGLLGGPQLQLAHARRVDQHAARGQQHQLAVADATHGHAADNVTLSTEIELSIADALHGHSVDNITLVQQHVLAVDDATHGHSADNVVLATGTNLAIADALHEHTVDNLVLTQQHVLVVADAFHQHTADNVVLGGLPVAAVEEGGGGPDREESEQPAERFTKDGSGWRKPKWVQEREQLEAAAVAKPAEKPVAPVDEREALIASATASDALAASLERVQPQLVAAQDQAVAAPAQQTAAVDLDRARIAAKVRQQREIEEIMTVLMMAA